MCKLGEAAPQYVAASSDWPDQLSEMRPAMNVSGHARWPAADRLYQAHRPLSACGQSRGRPQGWLADIERRPGSCQLAPIAAATG